MKTLARLLRLYRPYAVWLAGGIGLNVVVTLANVGLLALSGWFIAAMALSGLGGGPIEYFAPAAAIRGLAVLRTGGRYAERIVTHEATLRLLAELRVWFYQRLEPLAPARLQYYRGGDLLTRIRSDIDSLDNFYLRILAPTVAAAITGGVLTGLVLVFSVPAGLVEATGLTVAGAGLPLLAQQLGRGPGRRVVAARAAMRTLVSGTVQGLAELLVEHAVGRQAASLAGLGRSLAGEQRRQARLGSAATAASGLVAQLTLWGALVVTVPLVQAGTLSGPELVMLVLLMLASFEAVAPLPLACQALGETVAAARRMFTVVDAEPATRDPVREARCPERYDIDIRGLRMRYADGTAWALDGVDLHVPQGTALGIVGPSGSGKTSLLSVLLRFWDFQDGSVTVGGVPLRDLCGETVRRLCSVVAQQTHLFNRSVRDNLLLARPGATDAELLSALRAANLLGDILALPDGLDTLVGENGTRFSGGQARRLAIARALLKDAPILLLDEPTEGLDPVSERAVLEALDVLMRGRTTLVITHRPAVLRHVGTVASLQHGRVSAYRQQDTVLMPAEGP